MISYAIIRIVSDPIRDERINVGVVGLYDDRVIIRVPEIPTRAMSALLSQDQIDAVRDLPEAVVAALQRYRRVSADQVDSFLSRLFREGFFGFLLSEPQEREIAEPSFESAQQTVDRIFERVVMPLPVLSPKKAAQSPVRFLADSIIRRYVDYERRVVRNVSVQIRPIEPALDFAFAYANGRLVLGQAVDLDVRATTQRKNSDHALANFSDFERRVARPRKMDVQALHVVRVGARTDDYAGSVIERLQSTGSVLRLPEQTKELQAIIEREAQHNVERRFRELGFKTDYDENHFEASYQSGRQSEDEVLSPELGLTD